MIKEKLKNKYKLLIPTMLLVGILAYLFLAGSFSDNFSNNFSKQAKNINKQLEGRQSQNLVIPVPYNWPLFYTALEKQAAKEGVIENNDSKINGQIIAAIAPHHDLAAEYSAELFSEISRPEIKTVIIIGPNHENSGSANAITGAIDYRLLKGSVETDQDWINWLIQEKLAILESEQFLNEHSIYALVPFIKHYFPDAKIVPIILKSSLLQEQALLLGNSLADRIKANDLTDSTLIIGSIDFSHYLSTEQANLKDIETKEAILDRDYSRLYSLNDDYLDSPMTATAVLAAATRLGGDKTEIIANVNQAEATGLISVPSSTSYFTIMFIKGSN